MAMQEAQTCDVSLRPRACPFPHLASYLELTARLQRPQRCDSELSANPGTLQEQRGGGRDGESNRAPGSKFCGSVLLMRRLHSSASSQSDQVRSNHRINDPPPSCDCPAVPRL